MLWNLGCGEQANPLDPRQPQCEEPGNPRAFRLFSWNWNPGTARRSSLDLLPVVALQSLSRYEDPAPRSLTELESQYWQKSAANEPFKGCAKSEVRSVFLVWRAAMDWRWRCGNETEKGTGMDWYRDLVKTNELNKDTLTNQFLSYKIANPQSIAEPFSKIGQRSVDHQHICARGQGLNTHPTGVPLPFLTSLVSGKPWKTFRQNKMPSISLTGSSHLVHGLQA